MGIQVNFKTFILSCLLAVNPYPSTANVLLIDVLGKKSVNDASGLLSPTTGETMDIVRTEFC